LSTAGQVTVPYVDLAAQHAPLKSELLAAVGAVIDRGDFILGAEVERFEAAFAQLCGVGHAIGVGSGADALVLSLRALGIGPGDEVITAPNSFIASAAAIAVVGATPRFVDVGPDLNIDPALVAKAVTPRTKALLPVHLTGRPADMDPLLEIARAHRLAVVEDAAQAVLAEYRGRRVGSIGTVGCFSLHPLKTLNACGDGGLVTTNDAELARKLRRLRDNGLRARGDYAEWAVNSRLDTVQAAILLVKLRHLEGWTARRRAHAATYQAGLAGVPGLILPADRAHERAVYHTFVIQSDRRDALKEHLASVGVGTSIHYPTPIHLTDAAQGTGYRAGSFPVTEAQAGRILSLPVHPDLTAAQIEHVVRQIRTFQGANR
jgi:dTDP-4-amino-4,6-dideoxygalactose transaminase